MIHKTIVAVIIGVLFHVNTAFAEYKVNVTFEPATNLVEQAIRKDLVESDGIKAVTELINDTLALKHPIDIIFGTGDGPLYDGETKEILIPYLFLTEVQTRFRAVKYDETGVSIEDATMDALMHTLFHELGHALIPMFDFPVLGKEEDAVDNLATIMLIEYYDNGAEIAISAADLFDLESDDVEEFSVEDFWDEHSLDAQRFYNTLCMVYGSDPDKYQHIIEDAEFSEERADLCIEDYEKISGSWLALLEKHKKK